MPNLPEVLRPDGTLLAREQGDYDAILTAVVEKGLVRSDDIAKETGLNAREVINVMSSSEFREEHRRLAQAMASARYHGVVYDRLLSAIENGETTYEAIAASKEMREILAAGSPAGSGSVSGLDAAGIERMLRAGGVSEIEVTKSAKLKFKGFDKDE